MALNRSRYILQQVTKRVGSLSFMRQKMCCPNRTMGDICRSIWGFIILWPVMIMWEKRLLSEENIFHFPIFIIRKVKESSCNGQKSRVLCPLQSEKVSWDHAEKRKRKNGGSMLCNQMLGNSIANVVHMDADRCGSWCCFRNPIGCVSSALRLSYSGYLIIRFSCHCVCPYSIVSRVYLV